jgi:hypothetical protein
MRAKTPATPKARELKTKLEALAERGVNGEAKVAKAKLRRLVEQQDRADTPRTMKIGFSDVTVETTKK